MYMVDFMTKVGKGDYASLTPEQFVLNMAEAIQFTIPRLETGKHLAQMAWDYSDMGFEKRGWQKERATEFAMTLCDKLIDSFPFS